MSYFRNFPQILYSFDTSNSQKVTALTVTDILRRVKADRANVGNVLSYDEYDIGEHETPEMVADKVYNDPQLHWIILITNEILDPRYDWPLSTEMLKAYITDKYGLGNEYAVHHYVSNDSYQDIVHSSYAASKLEVTNFDYEYTLNESKRRISLLKPEFVGQFIQNFTGLLSNGS
jgi:hypothetical protein